MHRDSDSKLKIQLETCLNNAKEGLKQLHEPKVRATVFRSKAQEGENQQKFSSIWKKENTSVK